MSPKRLFFILLLIATAMVGFVLLSKDRLKIKQDIKTRRREYMQQLLDSVRTARDLYKDSVRRVEYGLSPLPKNNEK
jgi:ABC-type transport system involved in cytochrome bd biosynthesis fused ATPase/permease subunit